mmetsp:Transcript_15301/g.31677  ORF Transcript_15301/g.31677 Transcript_15301/m.31677 type:complete len:95 (+) Transcript_15301:571-855(+)
MLCKQVPSVHYLLLQLQLQLLLLLLTPRQKDQRQHIGSFDRSFDRSFVRNTNTFHGGSDRPHQTDGWVNRPGLFPSNEQQSKQTLAQKIQNRVP